MAEIFAWFDSLPKSFQKGGLAKIESFWAPEYVEEHLGLKEKRDRKTAVSKWLEQIQYRGKFAAANGPQEVLIRSIDLVGNNVQVTGRWSGSWRITEEGPMKKAEAGVSFDSEFQSIWKKVGGMWLMTQFKQQPYSEIDEAEYNKLKDQHKALKDKFSSDQGGSEQARIETYLLPPDSRSTGSSCSANPSLEAKVFCLSAAPGGRRNTNRLG